MLNVTPGQLAMIRAILEAHLPGVPVWAFGSRVSGTAKPHSDLDLAVITERPVPLGRLGALEETFAESDLPFRVDVIDWARTGEKFRAIIRRNCLPLAGNGMSDADTRPH
jgi:predicted nucleotidyltransferase